MEGPRYCPRCRMPTAGMDSYCPCGNPLRVWLRCPGCGALTRVATTETGAPCSGCGIRLRRPIAPQPEVDVRALQQHVQATGREVRATRISCWAVLMAIPCLITLAGLVLSPFGAFAPALLFLGGAMLATGCVALPIAAAIRRLNRASLRRRLQTLAPPEREAVLLPLQQDQLGDTRKIVAPLIRELRAGLPGEVIPAEPAEGRGDEPTPDY